MSKDIQGIPVTGEPGIDLDLAIASTQLQNWIKSVDLNRFRIKSVHIQSLDKFGPKVGFIKFKADVTDTKDKFLPGIVFARGGAVAVLLVLLCEGKEYAVLTVQPRIASGSFAFEEICAGMLDGSSNFAGVAAKELKEEIGEDIKQSDLTDLSALAGFPGGAYPSVGGCDETIRFYACVRSVTSEKMAEINGRCTGVLEEGEQITLKIVPLADVRKLPDLKSIAAQALYEQFRSQIPGAPAAPTTK